MTSGAQPPSSGAPTPVQGVTGGPPVLGGQISNDPSTGNVVVAPNPGQVLQVRKGSNPTALQVYEYFHTNTDYSRIALNSQTGGPFQLAVETAPSTVIRDLNINANGNVVVNAPNFNVAQAMNVTGGAQFNGTVGMGTTAGPVNRLVIHGLGATNATYALAIQNGPATQNLFLVRDDGVITIGSGAQLLVGNVAGALGFFASGGSPKLTVSGAKGGNAALASLMSALSAYGLVTDGTTA